MAAQYDGRYDEAVSLAEKIVGRLRAEHPPDHTNCALTLIARCIPLPGGERLLKRVAGYWRCAGDPGDTVGVLRALAVGCTEAWGGRDDDLRKTYYDALDAYERWLMLGPTPGPPEPPMGFERFAVKLDAFGRHEEAAALLQRWLTLMQRYLVRAPSGQNWVWGWPSPRLALANASDETRTGLWSLWAQIGSRITPEYEATLDALSSCFVAAAGQAPPGQQTQWCKEAGSHLATMATQLRSPAARARTLETAAGLLAQSGLPQEADRIKKLAASLTEGHATALLLCSLRAATVLADDERWADVEATLGPPLAAPGISTTRDLVDAQLLLAHAKNMLGKGDEAQGLLAAVIRNVALLNPTPAEHVQYVVAIAAETADPNRRLQLLDQARAAATDAGLDILADRLTEQIANISLQTGNLAVTQNALIEVVKRREQSREQLAFDPLLRRQWFADNLQAYRTLLRIAALRNDPELALTCAEQMRARALMDELNWRKVEIGAHLTGPLRERLENLRAARRETCALLQRVLGTGAAEPDLRAPYIPIRGAYIPIRGLGENQQPATAEEVTKLRERLHLLAREEAALEAAVREAVPSYAAASQQEVPEASDLIQRATADTARVVLEYTLCDEGIVVVGLRGAQMPQVLYIEQSAQSLLQRVGDFRAAIQERSVQADELAAELYSTLIGRVEPLITGAKSLWIVADGALQLIPFCALRSPSGSYLIEGVAVATTPSLSLAFGTSRARLTTPTVSALIVAAPETRGETPGELPTKDRRGVYIPIRDGGPGANVLALMASIPLPDALAEGQSVARQIPGAVLVSGQEATKDRVLKEAANCAVLHIATHGYADPDYPEFSGLLLAGGPEQPFTVWTSEEVSLCSL